jgi:hypothetical protein
MKPNALWLTKVVLLWAALLSLTTVTAKESKITKSSKDTVIRDINGLIIRNIL